VAISYNRVLDLPIYNNDYHIINMINITKLLYIITYFNYQLLVNLLIKISNLFIPIFRQFIYIINQEQNNLLSYRLCLKSNHAYFNYSDIPIITIY